MSSLQPTVPGGSSTPNGGPRRLSRRSISKAPTGSLESQVDPLMKLKKMIGTEKLDLSGLDGTAEESLPEGAEVVIAEYLEDIDRTPRKAQKSWTPNSIEEMYALRESLNTSHKSLSEYHGLLTGFQEQLELLSSDMEQLRTRSLRLDDRIKAYKVAETKLSPLVEALVISPQILKQIFEGEINARWRVSLRYLIKRRKELQLLKDHDLGAIKSSNSQIDLVVSKACEKIRDFMVLRIRQLRLAGANSQVVQQNLLENKELYAFLYSNHKQLALDLKKAYVYTIRWYYASYFSRYIKALTKLQMIQVDKSVLLGSDPEPTNATGMMVSAFMGSRIVSSSATNAGGLTGGGGVGGAGAGPIGDALNLGNRGNIVSSEDPSVILPSVAEVSANSYRMETAYRSLNVALLDNACVEFQFLLEYFGCTGTNSISSVFSTIFTPTFEFSDKYFHHLIDESYDAFGVLICIRIASKLEFELQHRKVPVMEDYLNQQVLSLWPRFQNIMDLHCESLKKASTRSSAFSIASQHANSLVPHQVTQHYASFVSGLLTLCEEHDSETEPVSNSMLRLRNDFESFLTKISSVLSNKQETFLYNNYCLVAAILSDTEGKLAEQEKQHFDLLVKAYEPKHH